MVIYMNLKSFREDKLKIKTQSAFAELIGVEQSSVSRWEKDPDSIPFQVIQKILEKTGATYEELTGWKKPVPAPLNVRNAWEKADFTKDALSKYISDALQKMELPEEFRKSYVEELERGIAVRLIKPKIAIVGRSDTGKSTLVNALLGTDKMPVSWTPTTSIAVYIKHISDKPVFMEEDVWIFANQAGGENLWDERRLHDESYCRLWKIGAGGVETLRSFGTRQGEYYDREAGAAVVFLDAPILKTCDIVDLPGFGTETEQDDNITFATTRKADVVLYLSQANGFMRIEDITYLKRNISELPVWEKKGENDLKPLSNLFVIASQAHTVSNGNRVQLEEIQDIGCRNLLKTLPEEYWNERQQLSGYTYADNGLKELRSRFFAYTVDIPDICRPFNNALTEILEALPGVIDEKTKEFVRGYAESRKPALIREIQKYEGIVAEREKYEILLDDIKKNELSRVKDCDKRKNEVRKEIERLSSESSEEFSTYAAATVSRDKLIQLMEKKGVKNKTEDMVWFGSFVMSMIQLFCETMMVRKSERFAEKVREYTAIYEKGVSCPFEHNKIQVDFDTGWKARLKREEFELARLEHGEYSSHYFNFDGFLTGLKVVSELGIMERFGGGWKKNVAKKICSVFDGNGYSGKYRDSIRQYWTEMETFFNEAAAGLDKEWNDYVDKLRNTVNEYDIQEIRHKIEKLKCLSDFFENIPL